MTPLSTGRIRCEVEVPLGSRASVRSGLCLGLGELSAAGEALIGELEGWQGPGVVVLAGGTFTNEVDVATVLAFQSRVSNAIRHFISVANRHIVLLEDDPERASSLEPFLRTFGITVGVEAVLRCTTATGTDEVLVLAVATPAPLETQGEEQDWLAGLNLVNDDTTARRLATSGALYRRLVGLVWIAPLLAVIVGILTDVSWVGTRLERVGRHGRIFQEVTDATPAQRVLAVLVTILIVEALGIGLAVLLSRRAFARQAPEARPDVLEDHSDQELLDQARKEHSAGFTGVIIGNAPSLGLSPLDSGFVALCPASGPLLREHEGRLGLPPLFMIHHLDVVVSIEPGADLHVALLASDHPERSSLTRVERMALGDVRSAIPTPDPGRRVAAEWPHGTAWPPPVDLTAERRRQRRVRRVAGTLLFATGLIDLLLAVIPPLRWKLKAVLTVLPLGVSQTAAAGIAIVGLALIMLARGIYRGQQRAWRVAVVLLGLSTMLHLIHAINLLALLISAGVLVLLVLQRRCFTAVTDRRSLAKAAPVLLSILSVAVIAGFFGVELSQRHRSTLPPWPSVLLAVVERLVGLQSVVLPDRVDDFLYPSMLVVGVSVLLVTLYLATRPAVDRRLSEAGRPETRRLSERRARDIVTRSGRGTLDYFALRDDKQYFFYGDTLVAYAVFGGVALVSPDPIGPEAERTQAWAAFRTYCDRHAWTLGVIGAGIEWLPIYQASGMRYLYLGDEAVVDVPNFSLEGGKMKGLRQACTRLERKGYTVEFLDPSRIDPARVAALVELMGLNRRGEGERGFSMQLGRLFDPKDQGLLLCIVSDEQGNPAAMCQFVPSTAIGGWSLDLMRRDPGEHPNGLLDYALCSTIARLKEQGATGLSLNFSAFRSTLDGERGDSISQRAQRWGLKRLSTIMPIETLWRFNEKYQPSWLARHLVFASPENFVAVVSAAFRAESITELPVLGRFLSQDPVNRPGTVVPPEILEAAGALDSEHP